MSKNFKVLMALMGMEIGGAETHVLELCKALKRRGADVYVASNGGAYEAELAEYGIVHFHVPLHNKQPKNLLVSYNKLKKIITEHNIKLVHAHARIPAFLCGLLHEKLGFRFMTTCHGVYAMDLPFKILTNWGERSLTVSEDIEKYLIDNYDVPKENIRITTNGIDTAKFSDATDFTSVLEEFGLSEHNKRIVCVSRLDKTACTAVHLLLDCIEDIYSTQQQLEVLIVGGGNEYDFLAGKAIEINKRLGKQLIFMTGPRTDINQLVASADIFVGISRAALEAMSSAKPVILAGNPGYIGVFDESRLDISVNTNFCCRGCEDTTRDHLRNDILSLLATTPEERLALGLYGRHVIEQNYSVERMADDALFMSEQLKFGRRPIDILISGYYGFKNHGDETVLKAIIDSFVAKDSDIKIMVLSMRPKETRAAYGVDAINRYNAFKIWRCLGRTSLLVTGGGSLIQDFTSSRSLFYYLLVIWAAMKRESKTMLFANGIGPLHLEKNKAIVGRILNKVDLITVRDELSTVVLQELGVTVPPIHFTADIAFSITTDNSAGISRLNALGVTGKYFCIAIRNWRNLRDGFEGQIAAFADFIAETYNMTPVFIPMQPVNDEDISRRVLGLMKNQGYYFGVGHDQQEIIGAISAAEFALCMRLHTVIYAAKAGVPVIGLVYDPKVKVMMEILGQDFYMNVEQLDLDKLKTFAEQIISSHDKISAEVLHAAKDTSDRALRSTELAYDLLCR